jgi:hypothetical protein
MEAAVGAEAGGAPGLEPVKAGARDAAPGAAGSALMSRSLMPAGRGNYVLWARHDRVPRQIDTHDPSGPVDAAYDLDHFSSFSVATSEGIGASVVPSPQRAAPQLGHCRGLPRYASASGMSRDPGPQVT